MKNVSFNEAINYLKDGEIILTRNRTSFYLDNGTVTVQPYQINYGSGWEDESGDASYTFNCSFDIDRVYGSGENGKIDLYQFIESGGAQYAMGKLDAKTGNTAKVYMVRP